MLHEALQMIHNKQMSEKQRQRKISVNENARRMETSTKSLQNLHNMTRSAPQLKTTSTGGNSSVTAQKLRESKWFKYNENKIFLSVVENGFILEKRIADIDEEHLWGIALWESGHEKSKDINRIYIYTLTDSGEKVKVTALKMETFWAPDCDVRINNQQDKEKTPNTEDEIRKQIEYSVKNKTLKWHSSHHFPYFCRYEKPSLGRIQQISERVKFNSIGVSLGMLMRGRTRRPTTSK